MRAILAAGIATGIGIGIASGDGTVDEAYKIRVLSSRPDMITGGDALVGIAATQNADVSELRVFLDGTDVTDAFRPSSPGVLVGLVDGIAGSGNLGLVTADGMPKGALSLVNHPIEGPVFSGLHQRPFICETETFRLVSGETPGAPLASDIVKCHLEPADQGHYTPGFSADDLHRLRRIFPEGVCDWSRPGVGQTCLKGTWQTFR